VGLVLGVAGPAGADPHDDKHRVDRQVARAHAVYEAATAKAQAAVQAYSAATAQLPVARERLDEANGAVVARQVEANQAERDAVAARAVADQADQRYDDAVVTVESARDDVSRFVAAAYKGGGLLAFDSLIESRTPNDLIDRLNYLDKVAQSQNRALDGYVGARLVAKEADNLAADARHRADAKVAEARDTLGSARDARSRAQQAQDSLTALVSQQARALAAANDERAATLAQYKALQAESDRIAGRLRKLGVGAGARGGVLDPPHPSGYFLTPVKGYKSSDFGMRFDPFYKVWQLHAGVDLAASEGTPIRAAADGSVVQAGWDGGYGNYTCLFHGLYSGQGLSTCYGHQSAILVSAGQRVHRGDVIGKVGTTGASTGDHLHFEVRVDGTPVQPLDWLNDCLC
jgi:murein DD-endopeptidase MepM/ murein hydrolase activator NlpD